MCAVCAIAQIKLFTQFVPKDKAWKSLNDWEKEKCRQRELCMERSYENKGRKNKSLNQTCTQLQIFKSGAHLDFRN